ncbi:MAG: hypothetical protein M1822_006021 [Bathelium mastoideum]|nr:MAG: hypothetical protein M1822_006021 [Bathelium mastoideum]
MAAPSLLRLPTEILQHIAAFVALPVISENNAEPGKDDRDLVNLLLASRGLHERLVGPADSLWGVLYRNAFPGGGGLNGALLRTRYQFRRHYLGMKKFQFRTGFSGEEKNYMRLITELLYGKLPPFFCEALESNDHTSREYAIMDNVQERTNIVPKLLDRGISFPRNTPQFSRLPLIRVMLAPRILRAPTIRIGNDYRNLTTAVFNTARVNPTFTRDSITNNEPFVNCEYLLDVLTWFTVQKVRVDLYTLYQSFEDLEEDKKPHIWGNPVEPAQNNPKTPRNWLCVYGSLPEEELLAVREREKVLSQNGNTNPELGAPFPTLELDFPDSQDTRWLDNRCQNLVPAIPHRAPGVNNWIQTHSRYVSAIHDRAYGDDNPEASVGWLNPLPKHYGRPGFQRLAIVTYSVQDQVPVSGIEAIVIPGGQFMIGRWSVPTDGLPWNKAISGPFIAWAVESLD